MAILITLLRFGAPWLASWQQQWMNHWLSEHQLELHIGALGISWQDYGPVLAVKDVSIRQLNAPTVTLARALVDIQLWQSLRQWRPVLNELTLEGLRLPIALDKQTGSNSDFDWQGLRHFVLEGVEQFSLTDAELWLSHGEQAVLQLHVPDWHWHNGQAEHQGQGWLAFSEQAEQHLQVVSQFTGKADSLNGALYVQANAVDASDMLRQIRPDDANINAEINFEFWMQWQQGQLIAGVLDLGDNRFQWGEQHQVAIKGGNLHWQPTEQGWQLASNEVDISVDEERWPSWHLQIDRQADQLQGYLDKLTFTDLALLAQWGESFVPTVAKQLAGIAPQGQLTHLYFNKDLAPHSESPDLGSSPPATWFWQGQLEKVSTQAFDWAPATQGLSGYFVIASDSGELNIQQASAQDWEFNEAFRGPWPLEKVDAHLKWQQQTPESWLLWSEKLAVASSDLNLEGWMSLLLPKHSAPLLSASARVDVLRAGHAYRYFPEPLMGSALVNYLQGAIVAGQAKGAEVMWYGRLNDFPYLDQSGIFQARVPLRHAEFRFDPDWLPLTDLSLDLLFENDSLYMQASKGRLGSVQASNISANIAPLDEQADLELNADINGEGAAVSEYLQNSPLASSVGVTLEQVQVKGPLSAALALNIPLNGDEVGVNGQVDFVNNEVRVTPLDLPLTKVNGRLVFDEHHTEFSELTALWLTQPLTLSYQGKETASAYEVALDIKGQLQPQSLTPLYPVFSHLKGEAPWQGKLQLTLPHQGALNYRFNAQSALLGLKSDLPVPFKKTAGQDALQSELAVTGGAEQAQIALQLGPQIKGDAKLAITEQGAHVTQLWLDAGAGVKPSLPRAPLDVALRVPNLVLDDWLAVVSEVLPQSTSLSASPGLSWPTPYRVAAQASRAQLWQQTFNQLHLTLTPAERKRAKLTIDAEQAQGQIAFGDNAPITADFSRLWLSQQPTATTPATTKEPADALTIKPSQVPALRFQCADCRWQQLALGEVAFNLAPQPQLEGVQLSQLSLNGPLLQATATGQWLQQNSVDLSRLEWQSSSPSLQRLWQALGKASPFSETAGQLEGKLRWLNTPWQPQLASMNGQLAVKTGAGVLRDLNDKGAGLLSVLSLESVMRRLRLDFRDVFGEGFYFDSISAHGELQEGVLYNEDLLLKGAAGDLRGKGNVNFVSEQLDYNLELTPNLTGNLPALAAFAVTPVAGLYLLALSKVLGPVVDVFTRIKYRVTGPISEPKVTELGRDKDRITLPE
ncbi:TIGR02099 family protein [Oceanisphaera avium]|uniref:TIGR02099 family protein n=2 Tax=Oceanisphaera avium TaxID=1903694 RepID=A0A1Y0D0V0_9GAMM|nr:TIGR02099 family protein [Oceanisphaera avium]